MSDEEIRALERAFQTRKDRDSRFNLARALARGERAAEARELLRPLVWFEDEAFQLYRSIVPREWEWKTSDTAHEGVRVVDGKAHWWFTPAVLGRTEQVQLAEKVYWEPAALGPYEAMHELLVALGVRTEPRWIKRPRPNERAEAERALAEGRAKVPQRLLLALDRALALRRADALAVLGPAITEGADYSLGEYSGWQMEMDMNWLYRALGGDPAAVRRRLL